MEHKLIYNLIYTSDYVLVVDDSEIKKETYCYDSINKILVFYKGSMKNIGFQRVLSHLPLDNSPRLDGVDLLIMKVTELRIGNYYDCYGDIKKVTPDVIEAVYQNDRKWVLPIPLTEEWLINFGFNKKEHKSFSSGKELIYYTFTSPKYEFLEYNTIQKQWWVLNKVTICQPAYVHQLQNLYFALTGEEL